MVKVQWGLDRDVGVKICPARRKREGESQIWLKFHSKICPNDFRNGKWNGLDPDQTDASGVEGYGNGSDEGKGCVDMKETCCVIWTGFWTMNGIENPLRINGMFGSDSPKNDDWTSKIALKILGLYDHG